MNFLKSFDGPDTLGRLQTKYENIGHCTIHEKQ
jgi:hypothetical protein